jgi:hypothetical protein
MAKGREAARRLVGRAHAPARPGPAPGGAAHGAGGGRPENPEARASQDFGSGGSAGPAARAGRSGAQMRSPGGRTSGGARTGG